MTKRTGTAMTSHRNKTLKPRTPLTDQALLASATRAAARRQKEIAKGYLHSNN
jgi:hypothetical protein